MKNIIANIVGGGGKPLSYLLSALGGTRVVASAVIALLALAVAQPAQAATDTSWTGDTGGTEANPKQLYNKDNWKSGKVPSASYNLVFGVDSLVATNNHTSAKIANDIKVNKGNYTFLGPLEFSTLWTVNSGSKDTIVKKGNWKLTYGYRQAIAANSYSAITNASGNMQITGEHYIRVGEGKGSTAIIENQAGNWTLAYDFHVGYGENSKAEIYWRNGNLTFSKTKNLYIGYGKNSNAKVEIYGGSWTTTGDLIFGNSSGARGELALNSGTVTVNNGKWTKAKATDTYGTLTLNGGTFKTQHIHDYGGNTMSVNLNGGTLQANAANASGLIGEGVVVGVGANGGTIHTGNFDISIPVAIGGAAGDGGMAFKGGGIVTLGGGNTYTGTTTVEVGTTLVVPALSDLGGGIAFSVPGTTPADGIYVLVSIDGTDTFEGYTLPAAPTGATQLRLSSDKKSILCIYGTDPGPVWIGGASGSLSDEGNWANGQVPIAGVSCVIGNATEATLTVGDTFAASSITFPADSAAITINAAASETISGIDAITNLSTTVSHTINAPVYFTGDIQVKQDAMAEEDDKEKAHVTFAGGAYAAPGCAIENGDFAAVYSRCMFGNYYLDSTADKPWTALKQGSGKRAILGKNSALHVPYAGALHELYVCEGSVVTAGVLNVTADTSLGQRIGYRNYGEIVITNEFTASGTGGKKDSFAGYSAGASASNVFKIKKATCTRDDGYTFWFAEDSAASHGTYYFGSGGINFGSTKGFFAIGRDKDGDAQTIRPWYGDFTIAQGAGNPSYDIYMLRDITFNTDDENGVGCTITVDARLRFQGTPTFTVSGTGKVLVNSAANNVTEPTVTVTDTATLEYAAGASLGTGPLSLGAGTTLVVDSADLPISVASLALPESGTATVQIKGDAALADGDYALFITTAALPDGFDTKVNLVLPDGTSATRRLYTTDNGTMRLFVGDGSLPDPYTWTGAANDGKMNTPGNWRGNAVPPAGATVIIPSAAGTLENDIADFAPASITFAYGDGTVTIGGEYGMSGVVAITNLSTTASHTINVPVHFAGDIQVKQAAMAETGDFAKAHVTFAGGAYAAPSCALENSDTVPVYSRCMFGDYYLNPNANNPWTAIVYKTGSTANRICLADDSTLHIPYAGNLSELHVGNRANLYVGDMAINGGGRLSKRVFGTETITNLTVTGGGDVYATSQQGTEAPGVFKINCVTNGISGSKAFYLADSANAASKHLFYIGEGGLNYSSSATVFHIGRNNDGNSETIRPWYSDFTIGDRGNGAVGLRLNRDIEFNTTDESGTGRTITIDAITCAQNTPTIKISGSGTLMLNKAAQNSAQPPVTVTGTATLAFKPGASLTTSNITVNAGAALKVAQSGVVALGCDLSLAADAILAFNFTERTERPVLDVEGKTVTVAEGGTIKVSVSGKWPKGRTQVLTSGGKFTGKTVELVTEGKPTWAKRVDVVNGDIVLEVKPMAVMVTVK